MNQIPGSADAICAEILRERKRQVVVEGFGRLHDDKHEHRELAEAASCYAHPTSTTLPSLPPSWPWEATWWKPKSWRENLIRAAALIVAEIERIDRASGASS